MALRKVKGNLERMFDKNLTDLIRGIRNNKENEVKYITQCMEEIKTELRQDNLAVKANAVAKLTFLQMLGYDIEWAGFNIIEVMSSSKFTYKRIGYLAASQCFNQDTEVLMLTTNMIRKDLNSQNMYDSGTALTGLACFINGDLAQDLANDVMTLLSSTKPYIRKKAVLLMYKVFLKYPEALRPAFPRLKEKLEDPDPGVQSSAVNVICELARKNPKNYLSLAPVFFKLMTSSTNNWMLIKIIKLFGALTPLEPRLGKKLIEPLTNLIHSTSAMSLLYECINTVIAVLLSISEGMPKQNSSIQLCVQKLRILIEDSDQNLKYLGLLAMSKILHTHPKSVQTHKDLILQCLDDKDESIRLRALDLLYGMVGRKNVMEIIRKLMTHMDRAEGTSYRDELLHKIICICSQNNYQLITNFEWYISVLVELCRKESNMHGTLISSQLLDVAIRVPAVREFTVGQMALLLENAPIIYGPNHTSLAEVLYAAAWICGEFSNLISNPLVILESMVNKKVLSFPCHIQSIFIQNIFKIYSRIVLTAEEENDKETTEEVSSLLLEKLPQFSSSGDIEVQERATNLLQLIDLSHQMFASGEKIGPFLKELYTGEMNPVAPKAQKKVPIPEGLDLDAWINEPLKEEDDTLSFNDILKSNLFTANDTQESESQSTTRDLTEEELYKIREARKMEQINNPYYVKSSPGSQSPSVTSKIISNIPVTPIDLNISLEIPGMTSIDKYHDGNFHKKTKKMKKKSKKNTIRYSSTDEEPEVHLAINRDVGEMPEGATVSDDESRDTRAPDDPHRLLNQNLDIPLLPNEVLPTLHHRKSVESRPKKDKKKGKDGKKTKKKSELLIANDYIDINNISQANDISVEFNGKNNAQNGEKSKKSKKHKDSYNKSDSKKKKKKSKKSFVNDLIPTMNGTYEDLDLKNEAQQNYQRLADDSKVVLKYSLNMDMIRNIIVISLEISNTCDASIESLNISVSCSGHNKTIGMDYSDPVTIKDKLGPLECAYHEILLHIEDDTVPSKIKGSIAYDNTSFEFCLPLAVTSFLDGSSASKDVFTDLLSSRSLKSKSSFIIPEFSHSFDKALDIVCEGKRIGLVEREGGTASLYSKSLSAQSICLLLKKSSDRLSVEGKSTDETLLSNTLDQLKQLLTSV